MAAIDAKMIMALREKTGMGMSDCKKALVDANGSIDDAEMILRKKGLDKAAKKAERATGEGVIVIESRPAEGFVIALEVGCEQEPTTGNDRFQAFVDTCISAALGSDATNAAALLSVDVGGEKVADKLQALIGVLGENVQVKRLVRITVPQNALLGRYVHFNKKAGAVCVIELTGCSATPALETVANDVCMHAVALRPAALNRSGIPADVIEKEKEVAREQVKDKPEAIQEKILAGKLDKFYAEKCLMEQVFVKDPEGKKTIAQVVADAAKDAGGTATITEFCRMELGSE